MQKIFDQDVSVNVHFIPVPMMSFYKELGYSIANYPVTYYNFSREISLPVYIDLTNDQVQKVIDAVVSAVESSMTSQHA
jgi:dTDP-4-amino-4,6-dideoxygalactose transaminase